MCCFCSIGFDADISHGFQLLRAAHPETLNSITINKGVYALLGVRALLFPPVAVSDAVLVVDGVKIAVPPDLRSLQVFNCHSSADGLDFFGSGQPRSSSDILGDDHQTPDCGDGLLEVVGTRGVAHLMQIRLGLCHSVRLAQGRVIEIHLPARPLVGQVDGESLRLCGTVRIVRTGSYRAVVGSGATRGLGMHAVARPAPTGVVIGG